MQISTIFSVDVMVLLILAIKSGAVYAEEEKIPCFRCNSRDDGEQCLTPTEGVTKALLGCYRCQSILIKKPNMPAFVRRACGCSKTGAPKEKNSPEIKCCNEKYCNVHAFGSGSVVSASAFTLLLCIFLSLLLPRLATEMKAQTSSSADSRRLKLTCSPPNNNNSSNSFSSFSCSTTVAHSSSRRRPPRLRRVALECDQT